MNELIIDDGGRADELIDVRLGAMLERAYDQFGLIDGLLGSGTDCVTDVRDGAQAGHLILDRRLPPLQIVDQDPHALLFELMSALKGLKSLCEMGMDSGVQGEARRSLGSLGCDGPDRGPSRKVIV